MYLRPQQFSVRMRSSVGRVAGEVVSREGEVVVISRGMKGEDSVGLGGALGYRREGDMHLVLQILKRELN